ncbi:MAG: polysaccharide biosynthesis/export family protein [Gemmatimonadales bacterium]
MPHAVRAAQRRLATAAQAAAVLLALCAIEASAVAAQERPDSVARVDTLARPARAMATRAELQEILAGTSGPVTDELARQVKERLDKGDLQPGDRIALRVVGEQALTDTFTVTPERTVELPSLPALPVAGVLRSELEPHLAKQLSRFIRNVDLQAAALVRVSMSGAVGRPGFYNLPADVLATDAIMAAGGPTGNADVANTTIRRGGVDIVTEEQVAAAVEAGESLDQLNIQSGDEIDVGTKGAGITGVLKTMGMISGALFGIIAVTRIF